MVDGRKQIVEMVDERGGVISSRKGIGGVVGRFYTNLYGSKVHVELDLKDEDEEFTSIMEGEVRKAIGEMKSGTSPGLDGITAEALRWACNHLVSPLTRLFNDIISNTVIPGCFGDSKTILLHKKGDPREIKNYRPISLLSVVYKCFTKVLNNRMQPQLDAAQDIEQAGFLARRSTIDQIHAITQLIEKANEYNFPLYLVFVDFEKAFDSIETNAVWNSLQSASIHPSVIKVLRKIYEAVSYTHLTLPTICSV